MTTASFKTIFIGLASLLLVSVAHGKCYPGLDCPEDLPNANNTPSPATPSTRQQTKTEPAPEPTAESQPEEQTTESIGTLGRIKNQEPEETVEEPIASSKYKKYKYPKYSKYPK